MFLWAILESLRTQTGKNLELNDAMNTTNPTDQQIDRQIDQPTDRSGTRKGLAMHGSKAIWDSLRSAK